jgi:hypothetical protein
MRHVGITRFDKDAVKFAIGRFTPRAHGGEHGMRAGPVKPPLLAPGSCRAGCCDRGCLHCTRRDGIVRSLKFLVPWDVAATTISGRIAIIRAGKASVLKADTSYDVVSMGSQAEIAAPEFERLMREGRLVRWPGVVVTRRQSAK